MSEVRKIIYKPFWYYYLNLIGLIFLFSFSLSWFCPKVVLGVLRFIYDPSVGKVLAHFCSSFVKLLDLLTFDAVGFWRHLAETLRFFEAYSAYVELKRLEGFSLFRVVFFDVGSRISYREAFSLAGWTFFYLVFWTVFPLMCFYGGRKVKEGVKRVWWYWRGLEEAVRLERSGRKLAEGFLSRCSTPRVKRVLDWLYWNALPYPASLSHHKAKTGGLFEHLCEVGSYALFLAQKHRLSESEREVLVCAALLHDVGKIRAYGYQGPTKRWEGQGGTSGFFAFLKKFDYGPREWVSLSFLPGKDDHAEVGARIAAEMVFSPEEDRFFVARVVRLVREHHLDGQYTDPLAPLLIEADRVMTQEEELEFKELIREGLRGIVRAFTPNLLVDGKVMLIWSPDLPDVLFVNSFLLREKVVEFLQQLGFLVPQRFIHQKVSVMDDVLWSVIEEERLGKDLPGVTSPKTRFVSMKLGKLEFKLLPLAVEKFFTKEEIEKFPPYRYEISLAGGVIEVKEKPEEQEEAEHRPPSAAEEEVQMMKPSFEEEEKAQAEAKPSALPDLVQLARAWYERFGEREISQEELFELLAEQGADFASPRTAAWVVRKLRNVKVEGVGRVSVESVRKRTEGKKQRFYFLKVTPQEGSTSSQKQSSVPPQKPLSSKPPMVFKKVPTPQKNQ